jgi:transcriptional regulator with XRE-family HTH domain
MEEKNQKRNYPNTLLRAARERRGWSQAALADLVGTTELTVGRWERGERSPQLLYRAKLCELFGMSAEELGLVETHELSAEAEPQPPHILLSPPPPSSPLEISPPSERPKNPTSFFPRKRKLFVGLSFLLIIGIAVGIYTAFLPSSLFGARGSATSAQHATASASSASSPETPIVNDPMIGKSNTTPPVRWTVGKNCAFSQNAYHMVSTGVNYCLLQGLRLSDFVYSIRIKIVEGTQAGIVFRADDSSDLYYFHIDTSGNYGLDLTHPPDLKAHLETGSSSAILQGTNQSNVLTVNARGSLFTFFINQHFVFQIQDGTYTTGYLGTCIGDYFAATQTSVYSADFQQAQVWKQ